VFFTLLCIFIKNLKHLNFVLKLKNPKRRGMSKKDIVYPDFLKCCTYTTNKLWKTIFEDLAHGKAPYGTYISKDFLSSSKKDREFSYKINSVEDPKIIYDELTELFEKMKVLSDSDKNRAKINEFVELSKENLIKSDWISIKKKSYKDFLIERFVIEMKYTYDLTFEQARNLLTKIKIAMIFKTIFNSDINYTNGKIENINGLEFEKGTFFFTKQIYGDKKIVNEVVEKKSINTHWFKYLSMLSKIK